MPYPAEVTLSEYILARIVQLGTSSIFGVPGDFNLEFLDYIETNPHLLWVGNANELNAAYSCDGYARVTGKLSVLVTTFGVGELSALCGVAGMMSERLPLLHLVGVPSVALQQAGALLHHTLGDHKFNAFFKMSEQISAFAEVITNKDTAASIIDKAILTAITECRPVYLGFPTNLVHAKVSSKGLETPLPQPYSQPPSLTKTFPLDPVSTDIINKIEALYKAAEDPVTLVDACAARFGMVPIVRELVEKTEMWYFETPMGKSTLDEQGPLYGGTYIGANSLPAVRSLVEKSDLVFSVGGLVSDFNSGSFSYQIDTSKMVEFHSDHTKVGFATYPGVGFRTLLPQVIERLAKLPKKSNTLTENRARQRSDSLVQRAEATIVPPKVIEKKDDEDDVKFGKTAITQKYLWPRVGQFLEEHDVVLAETGTSAFGILDVSFPSTARCLAQVLWGAIGWSVGACLGAALGVTELKKEEQGRTILFVGDGSLQLTVQEIGTMIRRGVKPFLFILNNDGYEIERQIHGVTAVYNDIAPYNHSLLLDFFSAVPKEGQALTHKYHSVSTRDELDALLKDEEFKKGEVIQLIEMWMPKNDAPRALLTQAKLTEQANAKV